MDKNPRSDERFLRRWSRRKSAAVAEIPASVGPADAAQPAGEIAESAAAPAAKSPPPPSPPQNLTDEHMPPLDSLTEDSDFSGFLSPGVSEALRRRALRKLFGSAVFNVRDGLDDYDDDFRNFAALGDHITSDMKHQMEMEEERRREAEAAEAPESSAEKPKSGDGDDDDETVEAAESTELPASPESPAPQK